jgi:hypothetical protein
MLNRAFPRSQAPPGNELSLRLRFTDSPTKLNYLNSSSPPSTTNALAKRAFPQLANPLPPLIKWPKPPYLLGSHELTTFHINFLQTGPLLCYIGECNETPSTLTGVYRSWPATSDRFPIGLSLIFTSSAFLASRSRSRLPSGTFGIRKSITVVGPSCQVGHVYR